MTESELEALTRDATYIVGLTVVCCQKSDIADFEGGGTWVFPRYKIVVVQHFAPTGQATSWTNSTLTLPGIKVGASRTDTIDIGGRYIAFYKLSPMAKSNSLAWLLTWNEARTASIESGLCGGRDVR